MALVSQLNFIECKSLGLGNCTIAQAQKANMREIYMNIAYLFGILFVIFMPISLFLSFFTVRPMRQASVMIDNFIANIVHDINTPISTILLNSKSLLKNTVINNKKLTRVLASAEQLSDMQHDLLALADENDDVKLHDIEIKEVVEEIIEDFKSKHLTQEFVLKLTMQKAYMNRIDFRRIMQNLLSNAIKYNQNNNKIKIYNKDALLTIEDKGKGMKHPEKVFEKNYREDYSIQGNGIGLASVLAMLERNRIEINVSSQLHVGTSIQLDFKNTIERKTSI